jgi:hypothetical protein
LTISGRVADVENFAAAARGSGIIPWQRDLDAIEEDLFHRAVAARGHLSIEGCHRLARQFCQRIAAHDEKAAALIGRSLACPFDLHVLLPIPDEILQLGPTDPDALAWLSAHWGISDAPRHIVTRPEATAGRRLPRGHTVVGYGFFTEGETPHAAIGALGARWPALGFSLQPRPG